MKLPLSLILPMMVCTTAIAQKYELKINASANLSSLPDFNNRISIVDGFNIPGLISISNARNPPAVVVTSSETKPGVGFAAEIEAGRKLSNKWKISLSLGVMQLKYDYDTHISQSFYKNDFYLGDVLSEYGNTRFTYLTSRPANISVTFNRFLLQGGAIVNYLISKKYSNTVVIYNAGAQEAAGAFFEEKGDAQKLLVGAHLNARFLIVRNVAVMLGGQYFFNALYKSENTYGAMREKSKVLQLQLGISYTLASSFGK